MTQTRTKSGLSLSVHAAEKFCAILDSELAKNNSSNLSSDEEKEHYRNLDEEVSALHLDLAQRYRSRNSDETGVNYDEAKAFNHLARGTHSTAIAEDSLGVALLYYFGLFTTLRLTVVRFNRLLILLSKLFPPILLKLGFAVIKGVAATVFTFLSFSYIPEFLTDLAKTCSEAYQAMPEASAAENSLGKIAWFFARFKVFSKQFGIAMRQDEERRLRMFNAVLWGPVNILLFAIPLALSVPIWSPVFIALFAVNILSFTLDLVVEAAKRFIVEVKAYKEILGELSLKRKRLFLDLEAAKNNLPNMQKIMKHIEYNTLQARAIHKKLDLVKSNRNIGLILVTMILAGVILYSIPGVNIVLATVGAAMALTASIIYVSRRVKGWYEKYSPYFSKKSILEPKVITRKIMLTPPVTPSKIKILSRTQTAESETGAEADIASSTDLLEETASPATFSASPSFQEQDAKMLDSPISTLSHNFSDSSLASHATTEAESANKAQELQISIMKLEGWLTQIKNTPSGVAQLFLQLGLNQIAEIRQAFRFDKNANAWNRQLYFWQEYDDQKVIPLDQVKTTHEVIDGQEFRFFKCDFKTSLEKRLKHLKGKYPEPAVSNAFSTYKFRYLSKETSKKNRIDGEYNNAIERELKTLNQDANPIPVIRAIRA